MFLHSECSMLFQRAFSTGTRAFKMSNSLYNQSIPVMIKQLGALSGILDKGEKWCDEKGKSHKEILEFRLIEDMRPYV